MYRCEACEVVQGKGSKAFRKIVEVRAKSYVRQDEHRNLKIIGHGFETVKEIRVCKTCSDEMKDIKPIVVEG